MEKVDDSFVRGLTGWFESKTVVHEGSIQSPVLFILITNEIINTVLEENSVSDMISLIYAEDIGI